MKNKRRQLKNLIKPLFLGVLFFMSSFVFAEEIIELEYGDDALESYKSYLLEPADAYISEDPSIVTVNEEGLLIATDYGETYVHTLEKGQIKNTYLVIVYFVQDQKTPFGPTLDMHPFIKGYPDGSFKPDQAITYGEYVAMVSRLLDIEIIVVKSDHFAEPYLQALNKEGLITDVKTSDLDYYVTQEDLKKFFLTYRDDLSDTFKDELLNQIEGPSSISRAEMVYYLFTAFSKEDLAFGPPIFKDLPISHPYVHYIHACAQE